MKKTIFEGTVNGEKFDNVAAYNAKLQELIDAGVEDITATSSTNIKVDNNTTNEYTTTSTKDVVDEDLSLYPYMCEDDPFYLDLLVTDDPVTNQEAYTEAQNVLKKCYDYTLDIVKDWCVCEREAYVGDIDNILEDINNDCRDNINAIDKIRAKRKKLEESYNKELDKLNKEVDLLQAADKVSDMFKSYYLDVRDRVNEMNNKAQRSCNDMSCKCNDAAVETSCKQTKEQLVSDLNSLIDRIFGDVGIYRR